MPRPEEVPKYNVAARCEEESKRQTETYAWADQTYITLAPAQDEQHCKLRDYYGSKHPHCLAQLNRFMEADLRLLMGGPVKPGGSGSSTSLVDSQGSSSPAGGGSSSGRFELEGGKEGPDHKGGDRR